ncbi:MAG: DUF3391 domain-containing protein, partial [Gammaproteobacteria bacterium]|nr:DUF3391 domain-containing protein [Gammaproteobacteria bacterium]
MIRRISVKDLKLGMFVHELHGSWIKHPFWKTRFLLEDPDDLALLKTCGISEISIDESRNVVREPLTEIKPTVASMRAGSVSAQASLHYADTGLPQPKKETGSFDKEFNRARELCNRSKRAVVDMFREARMGRA